jgi:hypothetical protein
MTYFLTRRDVPNRILIKTDRDPRLRMQAGREVMEFLMEGRVIYRIEHCLITSGGRVESEN